MATTINGNALRNTTNVSKTASTEAASAKAPVTGGKTSAAVDGFVSIPTTTNVRLTLTSDLQSLATRLASFEPKTSSDVNFLKAAYRSVDGFKPEDGGQTNLRDGLLETLGKAMLRNVAKFEIHGVNDLNLLNKVVSRFHAEDGSDLNALTATLAKVNTFEPQDGAELNTLAGLKKALLAKVPADAGTHVAELVHGGLDTKADLFALTKLLGEFAPTTASEVDLLKTAWIAASAFVPEDGADLNAKAGALEALTRTLVHGAGHYELAMTQDLQVLASVLKDFSAEDGSDLNSLEIFKGAVAKFQPEDGAQLNLKAALQKSIDAKLS